MKPIKIAVIFVISLLIVLPISFALSISDLNTEPVSQTKQKITWDTDENADSKVLYGKHPDYGYEKNDATETTSHEMVLDNLDEGTFYYFNATSCKDSECVGVNSTFTTFSIKNIKVQNISAIAAVVTFETSVAGDSLISYGTDQNNLDMDKHLIGDTFNHSIRLTNLEGDTRYYFVVGSKGIYSDVETFKTTSDVVPGWINIETIPEKTNNRTLWLIGNTEPKSEITVFINSDWNFPEEITFEDGSTAYYIKTDETGNFKGAIQLRSGMNNITIQSVDKDYNMIRETYYVLFDKKGPTLDFKLPRATTEREITVIASIDENATIEIYIDKDLGLGICSDETCGTPAKPWCCSKNNRTFATKEGCESACNPAVKPDDSFKVEEGNFNLTLNLKSEGEHIVTVKAYDDAGNEDIVTEQIAVDTLAPRIDKITFENSYGGETAAKNVVHFQKVWVNGTVSEPCKIRISNLGNSSRVKYNVTEGQYQNEDSGDFYQAGLAGDPLDLFYDYDTTVETVKAGDGYIFRAEILLLPGVNWIGFVATDYAGNTNVKDDGFLEDIESIVFEGGSAFWRIGTHSISPNFVVAGDLEKGTLPLGIMYRIDPIMLDIDKLDKSSIKIIPSSTGNRNFNNDMIKVHTPSTAMWDPKNNNVFVYTKLDLVEWHKNISLIPDPVVFELEVVIHYKYDNVEYKEKVYLKESIDIDKPMDYHMWLTPELIDNMLEFVDNSLKVIDNAVKVVKPIAMGTMVACLGMVVRTWWVAAVGHASPDDYKYMYEVCDRVGCPYVPPKCDAPTADVNKKNNGKVIVTIPINQKVEISWLGTNCEKCKDIQGKPNCLTIKQYGMREKSLSEALAAWLNTLGTVTGDVICTSIASKDEFLNENSWKGDNAGKIMEYSGCYYPGDPDYHEVKCMINQMNPKDPVMSGISPYDDIIKSSACVCVTGVLGNLENMQEILRAAQKCFRAAKQGDVAIGYCEKLLSMYVCDFIFWALKNILGLVAGSDGEGPSFSGADVSKGMNEVNQKLKNRYGTMFANQFGLGTEQLAHKACEGAITGDWTGFMDQVSNAMEAIPTSPQILPLMAESRVYTYDPFTGQLSIKYLITPGVWSGGQDIKYDIYLYCDQSKPDMEFCKNAKELKHVGGSTIPADDSLQDNIEFFDTKAEHWYNAVKMILKYDMAGKEEIRELKEEVSHKGMLIVECHLNANLFGPSIGCDTIDPSLLGTIEFKGATFSPLKSESPVYYVGNDVTLKLDLRVVNDFPDDYFLLNYILLRDGTQVEKDDIAIKTKEIDYGVVSAHLFNIEQGSDSATPYVYGIYGKDEGEKADLMELSNYLNEKNKDNKIYIKAESGIKISDVVITGSGTLQKVDGGTSNLLRVYNRSGDAEIDIKDLTVHVEVASLPATVQVNVGKGKEGKEEERVFAFELKESGGGARGNYQPGAYKLKLQLFKDADENYKSDGDVPLAFNAQEQIKELNFRIDSKLPDQNAPPKVEVLWPFDNIYCDLSKEFNVEVNVWDDRNTISKVTVSVGGKRVSFEGSSLIKQKWSKDKDEERILTDYDITILAGTGTGSDESVTVFVYDGKEKDDDTPREGKQIIKIEPDKTNNPTQSCKKDEYMKTTGGG